MLLFCKHEICTMHMCVDNWKVNDHTGKDRTQLPRVNELLDSLYRAQYSSALDIYNEGYHQVSARRRRNGGGPRVGCAGGPSAITPTSSWWALIILYPCKARHGRLGARRGEIRRLQSADHLQSGSLSSKGLNKYYQYTSVKISRSASPILPFEAGYSSDTLLSTFGTYV
jgi:hypothetical protein